MWMYYSDCLVSICGCICAYNLRGWVGSGLGHPDTLLKIQTHYQMSSHFFENTNQIDSRLGTLIHEIVCKTLIRSTPDLIEWYLKFCSCITGINPEAIKLGVNRYDRPLCPGLQPGPPSQTPGGLGQRYWSVSAVTWPPKLELRRWGSSGPSSLMFIWILWFLLYDWWSIL